jgi:RNA polymerase sigma-54 factor
MAISQRMDLRQSQSLVMTPQLQQAIKLLELSNLELDAYVEQELESNPLLERESDAAGEADALAEPAPPPAADGPLPDTAAVAEGRADSPDASPADDAYDNLWQSDDGGGAIGERDGGGGRSDFSSDERSLEETLSRPADLREHLTTQLQLDIADPAERLIGVQLIDMLDEAGYLRGELAAVADLLGCSAAAVETVLAKLQRCDPAGIFARNLAECLALQLAERNRLDPAMRALLDHLELLARGDRAALMKVCGVDAEDLAEMIAEIRALNPRPALAFDGEPGSPAVPDILMQRRPDGSWLIELNPDTLPRVLVNRTYMAQVGRGARGEAERDFLNERLASANWLVKSLHQRATTILKVASEIVRQQEAFFQHGVQHMRPLTRRDVAAAIGMHESTVSRVTTNKYIATPRGFYELRYFFGASIAGTDGESHAAEAVRRRIRQLIDGEASGAVLSDDSLVDLLQREGIEIARRTVAKYRESMGISSSVQRRREKALRN